MAESQFLITKCLLRPTEGSSLDEDYDIVRGNPIINYFESIDSPSISMTITFIDVDQVLGRKGITGGEFINLTIQDGEVDKFKITDEHKMMLNSVRNMTTETNKQFATLEFISVETIVNETARLNKKFQGNVSQTVEEILVNDAKGIQTKKKLEKNPTRLMLRVNDFGVAQKGSKKDDTVPESELAVYQNKSYIRNNLLFSQSLSIAIPLNTTLRVGKTMDIKLPLKKGDGEKPTDSTGNEKTNDPSGIYLISELRHVIGAGSAETQLTLIRDTFTA